jgi:methyltransferase (TIGR00027 family)
LEGYRADALLNDPDAARFVPFAKPFLPLAGPLAARVHGLSGMTGYVLSRHVWMDEQLVEHRPDEVIVLGAGYDTRARRLPGPRYWEVDHPATASRKRRLSPEHPAIRVDVDFERQSLSEELLRAGFPGGARTFVVWEGVSMYLTRAALRQTLQTLSALVGEGSRLVMDAIAAPDGATVDDHLHRLSAALMPVLGEPITLQPHPDDLAAVLRSDGWSPLHTLRAVDLEERYVPSRRVLPNAYVMAAERT